MLGFLINAFNTYRGFGYSYDGWLWLFVPILVVATVAATRAVKQKRPILATAWVIALAALYIVGIIANMWDANATGGVHVTQIVLAVLADLCTAGIIFCAARFTWPAAHKPLKALFAI